MWFAWCIDPYKLYDVLKYEKNLQYQAIYNLNHLIINFLYIFTLINSTYNQEKYKRTSIKQQHIEEDSKYKNNSIIRKIF